MENDVSVNNNIKTWIIVGVVSVVVFILVFLITNKIINSNRTKTVITNTEPTVVDFEVYTEGESVTLKNGSSWHVLYESDKDTEFVSLLSDKDVNNLDILYGNVNSFLKGTYKINLMEDLGCESNDIPEVRLLAYLDIATVSSANSDDFTPETPFSKFNIPSYITDSDTVTDTTYESADAISPMMICTSGRESAKITLPTNNDDAEKQSSVDTATPRFCLGDSKLVLPVRPVIVISKNIIKEPVASNNTTTNQTSENN